VSFRTNPRRRRGLAPPVLVNATALRAKGVQRSQRTARSDPEDGSAAIVGAAVETGVCSTFPGCPIKVSVAGLDESEWKVAVGPYAAGIWEKSVQRGERATWGPLCSLLRREQFVRATAPEGGSD